VPDDLRRPGHVFPLRARRGGVLERAGHTEAAVDLARLAGLRPAGVLCEVVNDDGTMARLPELRRFAADHGLPLLSIADLIAHRAARETLVRRASSARIPTAHGTFSAVAYEDHVGGHHVALVHGDPGSRPEAVVRVHTECFTGDVLASRRCDCGAQLHQALEAIVAEVPGCWCTSAPATAGGGARVAGATPTTSSSARRSWPTWAWPRTRYGPAPTRR
jgi:3,4-dihydroxy 2-butanone 4-phosphate synthase/GTP cyclohydrolase II